jgi:hypothetical protein
VGADVRGERAGEEEDETDRGRDAERREGGEADQQAGRASGFE